MVLRAVDQVDATMERAVREGSPLEAWLRLSAPVEVEAAARCWQQMLADELGDEVLGEVVRLTGDGLFSEALVTGAPPDRERVDRLVAWFRSAALGTAP